MIRHEMTAKKQSTARLEEGQRPQPPTRAGPSRGGQGLDRRAHAGSPGALVGSGATASRTHTRPRGHMKLLTGPRPAGTSALAPGKGLLSARASAESSTMRAAELGSPRPSPWSKACPRLGASWTSGRSAWQQPHRLCARPGPAPPAPLAVGAPAAVTPVL